MLQTFAVPGGGSGIMCSREWAFVCYSKYVVLMSAVRMQRCSAQTFLA